MSIKLYGPPTNPRLLQVHIVADLLNIPIEIVPVGYDQCESPEHVARNPFAKVPVIETPEGFLYESNSICRYLARSKSALYGTTKFEESLVDQWIDWTVNELDANFATTFPQLWGYTPVDEDSFKQAKNTINEKLKQLEGHFKSSTYLVKEHLTIADIVLVGRLSPFFIMLIDEKSRKQYPSVMRWFTTITDLPQFRQHFGRPRICKVAFPLPKSEKKEQAPKQAPKQEQPKPVQEKPKTEQPKQEKPKVEKPKAEKPKAEKPKAEKPKEQPKPKPQEEEEAVTEKKKNPLDLLPPSPFNIDDYKRQFFAEKNIAKNIEDLFKQVDTNGWSLWIVSYNKSENEGKKIILTNNLMKGFINQRLDQNFRKYAFAIHGVYGDEPSLEIRGAWLWRGTEVPQEWKDHVAYDYHVFRRIDITNEQDRVDFTEYWVNQEEDESKVGGLTARSLIYFR